MVRLFKNIKKKAKEVIQPPVVTTETIAEVEISPVCESNVNHPTAGPGTHHIHIVNFVGPVCCKCGLNQDSGKKVKDLKKLNIW